jgi:peptide/nickel transport system substrate-binding protein
MSAKFGRIFKRQYWREPTCCDQPRITLPGGMTEKRDCSMSAQHAADQLSIGISRVALAAGLAWVAGLGLAAAPRPALSQPAAVEPVKGGTMTIINGSDIKSCDPAITSGTYPGGPMDVLDAIYGFLVYVDVNSNVVGGMAESFTSTDAITWTLKLRDGLKFSDGTPYDAEAVKFNWERAADPATAAPTQAFVSSWVKGIKVIDARTLTVTLPSANGNFAAQIAELAPFIASPTMLKAAATKSDIKPVGAGAFLLDSWNQGISMTMKRNPGYWDQPRPYLDTLKFAIIPETNARIATVVQGGATMMAGYLYQFGSNASAPGVGTVQVPIRGIYRGHFNQAAGLFTDPRARRVIYQGVDRARLMKAYTQVDSYKATTSYFNSKSPYFDAASPLPGFDPAKTQALIDELAAAGKPFSFKIVTYPNSDLKRLASYMQQVMSSYSGVKVEIVEVDQSLLGERCKATADALCIDGGVMASNRIEPNISSIMRTNGPFNMGQYKNPKLDALLDQANSTVDVAVIKKAYGDVQKIIAEDLPIFIFGEDTRHLLVRDNTGGVVPSNGGILQKQYLFVCKDACVK